MSEAAVNGNPLSVSDHAGKAVARLGFNALKPEEFSDVKMRLRDLVLNLPDGIVIDCRELPAGAMEQVGPLLYDLLVLGRRQIPRVEISVVGDADQSTGDSKTFISPQRFETLEAALAWLGSRRATGPVCAAPAG